MSAAKSRTASGSLVISVAGVVKPTDAATASCRGLYSQSAIADGWLIHRVGRLANSPPIPPEPAAGRTDVPDPTNHWAGRMSVGVGSTRLPPYSSRGHRRRRSEEHTSE